MSPTDNIVKIRDWIAENKAWKNAPALSEVAIKLATYNAMLGDNLATLHLNASQSQITEFKKERANGASIADSEIRAKEVSLDARAEYENSKYVYQSTAALISALQSHLNTLRGEMRGPSES